MNRPLAAAVLLLTCWSLPVLAHEVRPALLQLEQTEANTWHALFRQPKVQDRFLNLVPLTNCAQSAATDSIGRAILETRFTLACDQAGLQRIEIQGLQRTLVDVLVRINTPAGAPRHYLITADKPFVVLAEATPAARLYLLLGIEHLLFGLDHLLFIVLLFFVTAGWLNLVKVITGFTLAHSITLALSALNIISLPQRPIEAMIALSIVVLAREVLRPKASLIRQSPWLIVIFFGLLHGFGFATALKGIGLPEESIWLALLLFNTGVELGQLMVIGTTALGLALLAKLRWQIPLRLARLPVWVAGSIAVYFFIGRALPLFV